MAPRSGVVHQDHEADGGATKDIEGVKTLRLGQWVEFGKEGTEIYIKTGQVDPYLRLGIGRSMPKTMYICLRLIDAG
jgi:hypothetical protein